MLPEPNFPVSPQEFIGRKAHLEAFTEALRYSTLTGRMASFAVLGDWGIGKSSLLFKLAASCADSNFRMLPVTLSLSNDISDYMKFAEALCDRLAHALLTSDSLATLFHEFGKRPAATRPRGGLGPFHSTGLRGRNLLPR